ncbi:hypothetical protein ABZU32_31905 [Sphaerisporangium sp. NPDC005288]|uniref:hypothetical protein n=1 Tax=Sphaerisporangium sp. NPDC005288 TaxID=3155114 RepID=UPI0033A2D690
MFRDRPQFALEILRDQFGVDVPNSASAYLAPGDFNDRPSRDSQADTVILVGPPRDPTHGVIVEIQQEVEESKRRGLARYAAALWLQLDCPVTVLVICNKAKVARWMARPITTSLDAYELTPKVFGPDLTPVITDAKQAREHPELAALSVMVHGEQPLVASAFMTALENVDPEHAPQYYEYAHRLASEAVRRTLEEIMKDTTWPVYSPFAKEHYGKGLEAGKKEARVEERGNAVLTILTARGVHVSDDVRERITACTDLTELNTWMLRSATATTTDELFTDD